MNTPNPDEDYILISAKNYKSFLPKLTTDEYTDDGKRWSNTKNDGIFYELNRGRIYRRKKCMLQNIWISSIDRIPKKEEYPIQIKMREKILVTISEEDCNIMHGEKYLWAPYHEPAEPAPTLEQLDREAADKYYTDNYCTSNVWNCSIISSFEAGIAHERSRIKDLK